MWRYEVCRYVIRYEVWKYDGWRYVGINKEVRALDTRVHENKCPSVPSYIRALSDLLAMAQAGRPAAGALKTCGACLEC